MNALLIFNPVAGHGKPEESLPAVRAALQPFLAHTIVTSGPGDARTAAREAALTPGRYDAVLVAGGDGTINEAINGLVEASPDRQATLPLGLIPLGTQNVLAHELGLPLGDTDAMRRLLEAQHTRVIDLGRAGDRYFALMAGFGFDAAVVNEVLRPMKELIGPAAYAFASLGTLARYHSTSLKLTLDGELIETKAYLIVVANTASYAYRQIKLAPFAAMDDGWLDVCVFERAPTSKVGFVTQLMAVLARRHLRDPRVRYYRARSVHLESDPPIQGQLDGDSFEFTPLSIEIAPKALTVFVK